MATGLTIDELRARFDEALSKYRRTPRTIITPVAFKSKKYFMLGKVTLKGVYTLDHFLPIASRPDLAREYDNLLYGCVSCNARCSRSAPPGPAFSCRSVKKRQSATDSWDPAPVADWRSRPGWRLNSLYSK